MDEVARAYAEAEAKLPRRDSAAHEEQAGVHRKDSESTNCAGLTPRCSIRPASLSYGNDHPGQDCTKLKEEAKS